VSFTNLKETISSSYNSTYKHYKELVEDGELRKGSFKFSLMKDISFIKYLPCQFLAFFNKFISRNFWFSLVNILLLLIFFSIFSLPTYFKKIPIIFIPLLGFINLVLVFVFLLFLKINYSFPVFLAIGIFVSVLIVLLRLLANKNCYHIQLKHQLKERENLYFPIILFLIGLFIITGHLGHLDIPRSYDHMSYSTLSSLLKIEGTYPQFNIYAFPSMTNTNIPSGWVVIVSFVSELLNESVARTQLILVMLFFPFLGIGVYYICRFVFKEAGWAFCAGVLALAMRMSSYVPTDGDTPEVLEWALAAFALFTVFSYLQSRDKRFFLSSVLSFFVLMVIHVKLALYTFGGFLFSIPFILLKYKKEEVFRIVLLYLLIISSVYILTLPHILSMSGSFSLTGDKIHLALIEFFENMVFRHGYIMILLVIMGILFFIKSKNKVIIFSFSYFLMFLIYFDQWILWDWIKPAWYAKELSDTVTFFGGVGTYTSIFKFLSTYSQTVMGFNIVLPILFIYTAYKIIPKRHLRIAGFVFVLFLIYESGIRPEVPPQLIGKSDFQAAKWIRENTGRDITFVANIGSNNAYLWNISGVTERKCLNYRKLHFDYLDQDDPLESIDFEDMLERNPAQAVALLKQYKFTHLLISEESRLSNKDFSGVVPLRKVYQLESNGKISRVFSIRSLIH